ncbi:MFS transporter [Aeromonas veronii]|uniref:MFS transporter n=1 Tax=Aeromonas veronii TaxID=654 RepID=UPI003D1B0E67
MPELNMPLLIQQPIQATRKAFFIAGFSLATWAPLIPLAKERLHVDHGAMGAILLAFGLGSLLMMPLSGLLAARYGCRRIFTSALLMVLLTMPALVLLEQVVPMALVLFVFGAGIGAMDVVVNIHAVITEKRADRPIMSGFHALFSLGGIMGAGVASALLASGVSALHVIFIAQSFLVLLMLSAWQGLLNESEQRNTPFFVLPHGSVIMLGALCFIAYIMEGAMLDWSGILLLGLPNIHANQAGIGYTLFAITMTIGRFTGDRLIAQVGHLRLFIASALLATCGFIMLVLGSSIWALVCAFLLIGLGLANIAPMLFTATGRQQAMPDALAVAAVSTMGYSGILVGPAMIGGIAHLFSLMGAFAFITVLSCALFLCARRIN